MIFILVNIRHHLLCCPLISHKFKYLSNKIISLMLIQNSIFIIIIFIPYLFYQIFNLLSSLTIFCNNLCNRQSLLVWLFYKSIIYNFWNITDINIRIFISIQTNFRILMKILSRYLVIPIRLLFV